MKKYVHLLWTLCVALTGCASGPTHHSLLGNPSTSIRSMDAPDAASADTLAPLVPARHYVADWDGNGGYQIAPNGKRLLWAARKGLNQGLFVKDLETGVVHSYALAALGTWAQDSRHILLELNNGDENSAVMLLDSFEQKLTLKNITPFARTVSRVHSTIIDKAR